MANMVLTKTPKLPTNILKGIPTTFLSLSLTAIRYIPNATKSNDIKILK